MRFLIGIAAGALIAAPAMADFDIINAGFEEPDYAPNGYGTSGTTGWTLFSGSGDWGSFYPTMGSWGYTSPFGDQVLYTNGVTVQQTLADVAVAGLTYTLEVAVVNRPTWGSMNYRIDLLFGDTIVGSDIATLLPPVGGYLTSTISYTVQDGDAFIGQPLTIRLGGPGSQCNFDNVTVNGVPAPTTLALLGLGGLVATRRRR